MYFCSLKTAGYNKKNKWKIEYRSLTSAIRPVQHSFPVPVFAQLPSPKYLDNDDSNDAEFETEDDSARKVFDQNELKDLARDLELS